MSPHRTRTILPWLAAWVLAGCSSVAAPSSPAPVPSVPPVASPTPSSWPATASELPDPSSAATSPSRPADGPPAALLAAEGGDAVAGQLGTYAWGDGGSDSPWLPGSPIAVGAGEPLSVTVEPARPVAAWRARSVPSGADGPDGATLLGEGAGTPAFAAPPDGSWTIEVHVTYAEGAGDASYFWAAEVS